MKCAMNIHEHKLVNSLKIKMMKDIIFTEADTEKRIQNMWKNNKLYSLRQVCEYEH